MLFLSKILTVSERNDSNVRYKIKKHSPFNGTERVLVYRIEKLKFKWKRDQYIIGRLIKPLHSEPNHKLLDLSPIIDYGPTYLRVYSTHYPI